MNRTRRIYIEAIRDKLDDMLIHTRNAYEAESEALENIPENLQDSKLYYRIEAAVEDLEEAIDALETAYDALDRAATN